MELQKSLSRIVRRCWQVILLAGVVGCSSTPEVKTPAEQYRDDLEARVMDECVRHHLGSSHCSIRTAVSYCSEVRRSCAALAYRKAEQHCRKSPLC